MNHQEIFIPKGIASRGIAMGKLFVVKNSQEVENTDILFGDADEQAMRFQKAAAQAAAELQDMASKHPVFEAHLEIARDETLLVAVDEKIRKENKSAAQALMEHTKELCCVFDGMDDPYLKERGADVRDVSARILSYLQGQSVNQFEHIHEDVIIGAVELLPSHTANMDFRYVKGFITEEGGKTSHVAIIAADRGVPAILGAVGFLAMAKAGDFIILDGEIGKIYINPDSQVRAEYERKRDEQLKSQQQRHINPDVPVCTKDGVEVSLFSNAGSIWDVENAVQYGAQGIGLFRTEFLYMESDDFPSEEEQFLVYRQAVQTIKRPLVIRTLDIGGDKALPYYTFEREENPFLGWRAIRFCLSRKDILKSQFRAILRAGGYGDVRIMLPMLVSIDELREAKALLEECKEELFHENVPFRPNTPVGIMVETPATVILAESFAKEVDFFSIGTNDLTQYILAADRGNSRVAHIYDPYHPAVLRAIQRVIAVGTAAGIEVGMCGAFAGEEKAIPLLLGMGLREFSVPASVVPKARKILSEMTLPEGQALYEKIASADTHAMARILAGVQ